MKIDRLIGILSYLLQKDKVTAPFLAEKFEVSRRTINRDIEDLCKAGIPLVTTQGKNGGISIMEGYRLDRTLLTSADMQSILTGLRSLDGVSGTNKYRLLMDKISGGNSAVLDSSSHIMIDLSSWYKTELEPKIRLIQNAIEEKKRITFDYFSPKGETKREIEPYMLVFQWSSWYLWGHCLSRNAGRLFKLNRMQNLQETKMNFINEDPEPFVFTNRNYDAAEVIVKAVFEAGMKWRLVDEYGVNSFTEQKDGRLLFQFAFTRRDNIISWLLTFGNQVELLEPLELREELEGIVEELLLKYKGKNNFNNDI